MSVNLKIDPYGFREYDARWLYEKDINLLGITNLGKGLGTQITKQTNKTNPKVIVGHDYRSYSEDINAALKKGLVSTGCFVEDVGLSLSPMVYFAQFHFNSDAVAPTCCLLEPEILIVVCFSTVILIPSGISKLIS